LFCLDFRFRFLFLEEFLTNVSCFLEKILKWFEVFLGC
jgi:hypothetical protein